MELVVEHLAKEYPTRGEPLRVVITAGGTPAFTVAAMMPLPEGLSELTFAGALAGHRIPMIALPGRPAVYAEADFVIEGTILPHGKPEGPFGDHTGYYNEVERFPVFTVERMCFRDNPIYHSTYTGRPPDEPAVLGAALNEVFVPLLQRQFPEIGRAHV